jgi:hypothetical protein
MNYLSHQAEIKQTAERALHEKNERHLLAEACELRMMMSLIESSAAETIRADRDAR